MGVFSFLVDISPWWWVAFGIVLMALEMMVYSFFLIWPGIAALVMAGVLVMQPSMSGEVQVSIFAVLSIALTFTGRRLFQKQDEPESSLNQRTKQIIGRSVRVVDFSLGEGQIEVDGLRWHAIWPDGQTAKAGDFVKVVSSDGMNVGVENI